MNKIFKFLDDNKLILFFIYYFFLITVAIFFDKKTLAYCTIPILLFSTVYTIFKRQYEQIIYNIIIGMIVYTIIFVQ